MKFTQTGTFRENTLAELVAIEPVKEVRIILLDKLDYLIGFVDREKPETTADYVKNLAEKYRGLVEEDSLGDYSGELKNLLAECANLEQYPGLSRAAINYYIHLLQLKDKSRWQKAEEKTPMKALVQAWIYPSYYSLQTLAETIGRREAMRLFKRYITNYYIDRPSPDRDKFVSLEKMLEDRISGDTTSSGWVIVHTMLEEGKYAFKNENCPTCADATTDLPDVEFKYLVCCYGDYGKFRAYYNDHIILTMEHTIIGGDPYCSRVLHDIRVDYDLRHPPKEFWDNFKPGREKIAKEYLER